MKPIRKAVRTFLVKDNKVVAIKYTNNNKGYYDIPGGKIEQNETSIEAAVREFKEETTMEIYNLKYAGNLIIEYPNLIFDLDIYLAKHSLGEPATTLDCIASWVEIDELVKKDKIFSVIHLLDKKYNSELFNLTNFKHYFIVDLNHKIIKETFEA